MSRSRVCNQVWRWTCEDKSSWSAVSADVQLFHEVVRQSQVLHRLRHWRVHLHRAWVQLGERTCFGHVNIIILNSRHHNYDKELKQISNEQVDWLVGFDLSHFRHNLAILGPLKIIVKISDFNKSIETNLHSVSYKTWAEALISKMI